MLQLEPDVAFGAHPEFGVVAETADERPFLAEVLRSHRFAYSDRVRLWQLPPGTRFNTALWMVASASREFQGAGLAVLTDPRVMIPPAVPAKAGARVREAVPGLSLTAVSAELSGLGRAADVADALDPVLDEDHGVFTGLEGVFASAASWCERLGTEHGRELAGELRSGVHQVVTLGERLLEVQLALSVMPDTARENAPAPVRERSAVPDVSDTARARSAVALGEDLGDAITELRVLGEAEPTAPDSGQGLGFQEAALAQSPSLTGRTVASSPTIPAAWAAPAVPEQRRAR
ncbi:hypothetical protein [Streptomyces sp. NPDC002490]|uniref:hypothetical protein n=1 Tax=Streptomyces sp. NPDC002490 TaxID=3154416 RepID=UPI003327DD65